MPWETNRRGFRYYTRTLKGNGRRLRRYFGNGPAAERAAAEDRQGRAERAAAAERRRAERAHLIQAGAPVRALSDCTDLLTRATLVAAGYWQHDRGEWRKRRHGRHQY